MVGGINYGNRMMNDLARGNRMMDVGPNGNGLRNRMWEWNDE